MIQEVKYIAITDLVLWTENPRDPVNAKAKDQDIVNRALEDRQFKWSLSKLAREMGDYYDFSEIPTVVYHGKKPVVYDGNRRVVLGKIRHGLVTIPTGTNIQPPDVPEQIPCNVCTEKVALQNVLRKHGESGSWQPLERDMFLHKFMGEEKSSFLILEEDTGIITANPHLNQRFVKEEIFRDDTLKSMGFTVKNGRLNSVHSNEDAREILSDITKKVKSGTISTRNNRGKVLDVLEPASQQLIDQNKNSRPHLSKIRFDSSKEAEKPQRQSRRSPKKANELFGGKLYLRIGVVSNLYRDITDLYDFYISRQDKLSQSFPGLIRMSLRLLCETAAKENKKKIEDYLKENFDEAKKTLDQDIKTTLSGQNVSKETIMQLLHTGAHNYQSTFNLEQTIAVSIAIGATLSLTHGKAE
jgi:hypothetical protein